MGAFFDRAIGVYKTGTGNACERCDPEPFGLRLGDQLLQHLEEFSDGTLARRFAIRVTPEIGFPDGCPGKVCFVHLLPLHDPQQIFVPPMSTARTPS